MQLTFRFYGSLNDFLPHDRRQVTFNHVLSTRASIKDVIESLGVPHPEVALVLVDGDSVGFEYVVKDGDRVSAYPRFVQLDVSDLSLTQPRPVEGRRFVVDGHLGRLAAYLRFLGFDTVYDTKADDETLAAISASDRRVLLSRDRGLLKRSAVEHGYCIRSEVPREQLLEALDRFDLAKDVAFASRCVRCNGQLAPASPEAVDARVPPRSRAAFDQFWQCADCGKVYWLGSHYERMRRLLERVTNVAAPHSSAMRVPSSASEAMHGAEAASLRSLVGFATQKPRSGD